MILLNSKNSTKCNSESTSDKTEKGPGVVEISPNLTQNLPKLCLLFPLPGSSHQDPHERRKGSKRRALVFPPIKTFLSSQQGSKVEGLREEILRADLQKRRNNIPPETANLDRASSGPWKPVDALSNQLFGHPPKPCHQKFIFLKKCATC